MVEVSHDGRLLSDGTQIMDAEMAKALPPPKAGNTPQARASRDSLQPLSDKWRDTYGLNRKVRFDLPVGSFENLKDVSEILRSLALTLEGLSYMRHQKEGQVLLEARWKVREAKRKLANI